MHGNDYSYRTYTLVVFHSYSLNRNFFRLKLSRRVSIYRPMSTCHDNACTLIHCYHVTSSHRCIMGMKGWKMCRTKIHPFAPVTTCKCVTKLQMYILKAPAWFFSGNVRLMCVSFHFNSVCLEIPQMCKNEIQRKPETFIKIVWHRISLLPPMHSFISK